MFGTIFLFIAILGLLVLIHEGGHFVAAKLSGVRVEEFGLGFPPRLFARKRGETEYSVNVLPFGGFVRLAGEDGSPQQDMDQTEKARFFNFQDLRKKMGILFAGVAVNWFFAAFLFSVLQVSGSPIAVPDADGARNARVSITAVADGSPAKAANVQAGDVILGMRDQSGTFFVSTTIAQTQQFIREHAGQSIVLSLTRNGQERSVAIVPRKDPPKGEGALGVALVRVVSVSYPWYEAVWRGVFVAASMSVALVHSFGQLVHDFFAQGKVADGLAGPVGIAALTGDAASLGFFALTSFIAVLSLNLAVLNAVPFPALDGGRAFIVLVEAVLRRQIPARGLAMFHAAGFALLLVLLLAITVRDIRHLL